LELASSANRTFKVFSEGRLIRDKTARRAVGSGGQGQASGTDAEVLKGEGEMIDSIGDDNRIRATLSNWYRSGRYRSDALKQLQIYRVPSSRTTELNREFKEAPWFYGTQWFLVPLIAFTIMDFFYLNP
jgi:hypothetical protein